MTAMALPPAELTLDHTMSQTDSAYYAELAKHDVPREPIVTCLIGVAAKLNVHADYIYTLAIAEGGETGKYRQNNDGTHDMGVMQINYETWAVEFPRIGYHVDWRKVLKNTCSNILAGGTIFRYRARNTTNELTALANYHWYGHAKNKGPHNVYKERVSKVYLDVLEDKRRFIETGKVNWRLRCKYAPKVAACSS